MSEASEGSKAEAASVRPRPEWLGLIVGLVVFLAGIALIGVAFQLAYQLFAVPPNQALGIEKNKPLDVATAGGNLSGLLVRVLLLVAMGLFGSLVASRGIALYGAARRSS